MMKRRVTLPLVCCCLVSGCSGLVLEERDRALDEAFEKGKISKIEYLSSKHRVQQEGGRTIGSSP